ncbi:DUF2721 domain-containing protein [Rhizobium sp. TH2]|uniref:DUF2721 domain-containing protein n=1 Tax=Rhizobium sp. TH2 TaxID=2775403 RepID=UPI0021576EBF|nr:DUF2721 domain-containing protein [Rhizobium sp. TH2]UVC08869.1 DUF2721 domain-containing protein [Rhizobium sp. TH2]
MYGDSSAIAPSVVNVLETALTPVFLLAGTAGMLNVVSTRLARISDRANDVADIVISGEKASSARSRQLAYLRRRTLALETSAILAGASAIFTCLSTLGLMAGAIREDFREAMLIWLFSLSVILLMGAFVAFMYEMISAARSMMRQIADDKSGRKLRTSSGKTGTDESIG